MKTLKNKTALVKVLTKEGVTDVEKKYSDLIQECVNNTPKDGFSISEMQHRMRILKEAQKANGEIKLEDADFRKLQDCVKEYRWLFISEDVISFAETIILMK